MHKGKQLTLLGLALVVGAFLPWVVIKAIFGGSLSKTGIEGDGQITVAVGVILVYQPCGAEQTK